ncbi:hypothetical protein [Pontibacter cellulosilyticus]|uniref:Oligosaccharide repeat unit polymerase n=1 Tax=Pontibacter cellulosilyticus TaxID=1720253 RepID=A0A923N6Y3_9BACT|nr:hypothetical protein [Pontibacter cellulosilyticus]MBC5991625.1 hypothetical protein [Pontibacter cellulosilyticus]
MSGYHDPVLLCITVTAFSVVNFLLEIGKTIGIRSLTFMIATVQWVLGPFLSYSLLDPFDYYYMPVPQDVYFALAIPGVLLFALGLYSINDKYVNEAQLIAKLKTYLNEKHSVGLYLIFTGFLFSYLGPLFPGSLAFFFYLLSSLKYVGAFYVLLSNNNGKYLYFAGVFFFLFLDAFTSSMFHELLLWLAFTFLLLALNLKLKLFTKFSLLCLGFVFVFAVQAIKGDYRSAIWGGEVTEQVSKVDLLESSFETRIASEGLFNERNIHNFIYRINQGWIVGHVMAYTPKYQDHARGETIMEGVVATLLPRFLAPDKVTSGGAEYFEKYSGLILVEGTSMDLSPIGEAYANFATMGGATFMFFLGLLYAAVLSLVSKLSFTTPTLILWIPLLFQQAIKAESDITTGINHVTKAAVVIYLVYWVAKNIFKVKL